MSGKISQNPNRQSGAIGSIPSATEDASNPARTTNPSSGVGTEWINTTSAQIFLCTDATAGDNTWVGQQGSKIYGARGVLFCGSDDGTRTNQMQYITIPTTGNAVNFGDCSAAYDVVNNVTCSNGSNDRCVSAGGMNGAPTPIYVDTMEYVTVTTTGNSTDFGNISDGARQNMTGTDNGTNDRGFFAGGYNTPTGDVADIRFISVSSTSNTSDFGDLSSNDIWDGGCATSEGALGDRAIVMGGARSGARDTVQYYLMSTPGNSIGFGTLSTTRYATAAMSNEVRAICSGGYQYPNGDAGAGYCTLSCDYFTISTTGNATVFGNMTGTVRYNMGGCSSGSYGDRGVLAGGYRPGVGGSDIIDYCTISSAGNFTDFGDLLADWSEAEMGSNGFS